MKNRVTSSGKGTCVKYPSVLRPDDAGQDYDMPTRRSESSSTEGVTETPPAPAQNGQVFLMRAQKDGLCFLPAELRKMFGISAKDLFALRGEVTPDGFIIRGKKVEV